jgi:Protein of unknown function (DUF3108)
MTDRLPPAAHRRHWALACLVAVVVIVHALLTQSLMAHLQALGGDAASQIKRMQVDLVSDMELTEPPVVVSPPPQPPPPAMTPARPAPAPASAASKPKKKDKPKPPEAASAASSASTPEPAASSASAPTQLAQAPSETASQPQPEPAVAAASAASGPAFEWPMATRVSFKVEGYFRGPIYGTAQVEWVRQDLRYQVHVDAVLGPIIAPLGSRRWTSDGVITPQGLTPQKFESIDKLLIKSSPPKIIYFEDDAVVLSNGDRVAKMAGVQDAASHYIQLAYRFIQNPALLKVGSTVELPVALPKQQEIIIYDIDGEEALDTPMGKVDTFKLKPRRVTNQKADVLAEIWVAPGLQYLPIRMLVRQGDQNFLDMKMDRRPQQTSAAAAAEAASAASTPDKLAK